MEIYGEKTNIKPEHQPLFDAMKRGDTIKSVTCFSGMANKANPTKDFTIKNFIAESYSCGIVSKGGCEYFDYVETNQPDRKDATDKAHFYMNWIRSFEL